MALTYRGTRSAEAPDSSCSLLPTADLLLLCAGVASRQSLLALVLGMLGFRLAVVLGALANEWAHLLIASLLGAGRHAWRRENLGGHCPLRVHAAALLPFTLDRRGDLFVEIAGLDATSAQRVRVLGFWLSSAVLVAAGITLALGVRPGFYACAFSCGLGLTLSLLASFLTDVSASSPYRGLQHRMGCGNLTLLGRLLPGETRALPSRVSTLLQDMLLVNQMRGAQSGGAAITVSADGKPRQRIEKCVNDKRSNLAARLTRSLRSAGNAPAYGGTFLVQAHMRFATSGPATLHESHPFRFVEVAQHGPRRVFRPGQRVSAPELRAVETAITHNGDFNALCFRGVRVAHPELGYLFERVLEADNRWSGDSPALAGAFELFLTQGLWLESLRLAYLEVIAPPPPDVSKSAALQPPEQRAAFTRRRVRTYPAPTRAWLAELAEVAERTWLAIQPGAHTPPAARGPLVQQLAAALRPKLPTVLPAAVATAFAQRALDCFLDHDLFRAARELLALVEGTFGCVITSTLEPDVAVAFARGQPLSLAVQLETGVAAIASERNALRVRGANGEPVFDTRLDLDLDSAEIARIAIGDQLQPKLVLHSVSERHTYTRDELERSGRLVSLRDNPLTPALPIETADRVQQDLDDVPAILRAVRAEYNDVVANNRRSAETLAYALLSAARPRLLVLGITNDLWLARQFVHNLKLCLRDIHAEAISSNEFLKESRAELVEPGTVVLAVSQSGQDFPTLAVLCQLRRVFGEAGHGRLFVLTGEADTLMGQAVGQSFSKRALWLGRILTNCGGYRPSEAATACVNATHLALCELLLAICRTALELPQSHGSMLGPPELAMLEARRDALVELHAEQILSPRDAPLVAPCRRFAAAGHRTQGSPLARAIAGHARRFSRHVLEGFVGLLAAGAVLEGNLALGLGLVPSSLLGWLASHGGSGLQRAAALIGHQADVAFYLFLAPLFVWSLRLLQRRPLLHRQGVRELLIADTEYVRQIVWLLARKLFSLSYGFASLKPYAADNQDDLVMTHEPLRGTLALFGVPDARRTQLGQHASAAWMTARQFASSRSVGGSGAEVITVGHAPADAVGFAHVSLPSAELGPSGRALDLLIEGMFDSAERMLAMQSLLCHFADAVASFRPLAYDSSRTKDRVFAPTTASPVSAASVLGMGGLAKELLRFSRVSVPFEVLARRSHNNNGPRASHPPPEPEAPLPPP